MQKSIGTILLEMALAVATAILIAAAFWFLYDGTRQQPEKVSSREETFTEKRAGFGQFDADNDGLLDWEEALWQTDPQNADTDGDGTSDGEEVAARRDPRKAGPDDTLDAPFIAPRQEEKAPLSQATPVKKAPPSTMGAGETTPAVSEYGAPFGKGETPDSENNPLYSYGNEIGALIRIASADQETELAFLNSAAGPTKMDEELIAGFEKLAQKYDTLAENIASVIPPVEAEIIHAELASAYKQYAKAIESIAQTSVGSYMSYTAITAYANATLEIGKAVVGMSNFFYGAGVRFPKDAPGAVFMFPR